MQLRYPIYTVTTVKIYLGKRRNEVRIFHSCQLSSVNWMGFLCLMSMSVNWVSLLSPCTDKKYDFYRNVLIWCSMVWYGVIWYGMVWYDAGQYMQDKLMCIIQTLTQSNFGMWKYLQILRWYQTSKVRRLSSNPSLLIMTRCVANCQAFEN